MRRRWLTVIMIIFVELWMLAAQAPSETNPAFGGQPQNEPTPAMQEPTGSPPQRANPQGSTSQRGEKPPASPGQPKLVSLSGGGVELAVGPGLVVQAIRVHGKPVSGEPAPLVSLCDVAKGKFCTPSPCDPASADTTGQFAWDLRFPELQASIRFTVGVEPDRLRLSCRVQSHQAQPRGMLLRLALPVDARGWQWHQDMQTAVPIEADKRYENVVPLRAWADLPEWRDQPDLRMGYSNRHFLTVLTGPVGLCLAAPVDRPCIFRTGYHGPQRRLEIVYDFALCPETRTPNEAEFLCELFACDPAWGFRDALARYYRLYSEAFENRIAKPGQWLAFSRLSEIDNPDEFYFGLQEGASEPAYDDPLGVLSLTYFTHAGIGANIPGYDPEKEALPPYEVQVAAMEAAFKRQTGMDGLFAQAGLQNAEGKLDVRPWKAYGHLIAQFNLDPHLPYGRWVLQRALQMLPPPNPASMQPPKEAGLPGLDGFYYDGLPTGLNYNPAHFKTADAPCLWDPVHKKPLLNNFFSSCQFVRAAAEALRPRGAVTMMNGALGASFYVAPWLDVLGSERGLRLSREQLNYIRSITYKKPFLTLLKGNYEQQIGREQIQKYMKQCLAYGIPAGFFDWPTSGLGPGSRYWDHPRYYERDRDLFGLYMPVACTLARIGWEPVPYARSSEPKVYVERFGPNSDGLIWWTVMNEDTKPHKVTLQIEPSRLPIDPGAVRAVDAISGEPIPLDQADGRLLAQVDLEAGDVRVLQLGRPGQLVRWRIAQAVETLDRGMRMRRLDRQKPARAVHWRPGGSGYGREKAERGWELLFTGNGRSPASASQWAMLFQQKAAPVVLRVRAAAEGLKGPADQIGVRCRAAWVTPSFAHYETRFLPLPPGSYAARDFELRIDLPQPLRAVEITPTIGPAVQGKLRLAKISLADPAAQREYVVDPEFTEWYEPVPESLWQPIEDACQEIRRCLLEVLEKSDPAEASCLRSLEGIKVRCEKVHKLIRGAGAEAGCRRVLRDLATVGRHLDAAAAVRP